MKFQIIDKGSSLLSEMKRLTPEPLVFGDQSEPTVIVNRPYSPISVPRHNSMIMEEKSAPGHGQIVDTCGDHKWIYLTEEGCDASNRMVTLRILDNDGSQLGMISYMKGAVHPQTYKELREMIRSNVSAIPTDYSFEHKTEGGRPVLLPRQVESYTPFDADENKDITLIPKMEDANLGRWVVYFLIAVVVLFIIKDVAFQGTFAACWAKILDTLNSLIIGYFAMIMTMFDQAVAVVVPVIEKSVEGYFRVFTACWKIAFLWPNPIFMIMMLWLSMYYAERYLKILVSVFKPNALADKNMKNDHRRLDQIEGTTQFPEMNRYGNKHRRMYSPFGWFTLR